jgi:hypothetical protein
MRKLSEVGLFDQFPLLLGQPPQGVAQFVLFLLEDEGLFLVRPDSGPQGRSSGSGRRVLRIMSILRFRAIVKIHVATLAREGSNRCALCQRVAITSCVHSSARVSLAPDFNRNAFTRGAK